jgi:hypothetical protein
MHPSNREIKQLNAIKHNKAYLESKKPKPKKPVSRNAKLKAQTILAISAGLTAKYH